MDRLVIICWTVWMLLSRGAVIVLVPLGLVTVAVELGSPEWFAFLVIGWLIAGFALHEARDRVRMIEKFRRGDFGDA